MSHFLKAATGILCAALLSTSAFAGSNGIGVSVNGALYTGAVISGLVRVNLNTTLPALTTAGSSLQIDGADGAVTVLGINSYAQLSSLTLTRADTSAAAPSAVQSGENLGQITWRSYYGAAYSLQRAAVAVVAAENWSASANGTTLNISTTKPTTSTTSTTLSLDGYGHTLLGLAAVPAITSCGTSPSTARGTDFGGEVTEGTTATGCTITFANAYTTAPFCVVSLQTQLLAFAYTISTTAITVTNTSASGDKINWICNGQ